MSIGNYPRLFKGRILTENQDPDIGYLLYEMEGRNAQSIFFKPHLLWYIIEHVLLTFIIHLLCSRHYALYASSYYHRNTKDRNYKYYVQFYK